MRAAMDAGMITPLYLSVNSMTFSPLIEKYAPAENQKNELTAGPGIGKRILRVVQIKRTAGRMMPPNFIARNISGVQIDTIIRSLRKP